MKKKSKAKKIKINVVQCFWNTDSFASMGLSLNKEDRCSAAIKLTYTYESNDNNTIKKSELHALPASRMEETITFHKVTTHQ